MLAPPQNAGRSAARFSFEAMPDVAAEAIEAFQRVAAAFAPRDWQGAAAVCDARSRSALFRANCPGSSRARRSHLAT
jgi:hypothetical protein